MKGAAMNADQMTSVAQFLEGLTALTQETGVRICVYQATAAELVDGDGDTVVDSFQVNIAHVDDGEIQYVLEVAP